MTEEEINMESSLKFLIDNLGAEKCSSHGIFFAVIGIDNQEGENKADYGNMIIWQSSRKNNTMTYNLAGENVKSISTEQWLATWHRKWHAGWSEINLIYPNSRCQEHKLQHPSRKTTVIQTLHNCIGKKYSKNTNRIVISYWA